MGEVGLSFSQWIEVRQDIDNLFLSAISRSRPDKHGELGAVRARYREDISAYEEHRGLSTGLLSRVRESLCFATAAWIPGFCRASAAHIGEGSEGSYPLWSYVYYAASAWRGGGASVLPSLVAFLDDKSPVVQDVVLSALQLWPDDDRVAICSDSLSVSILSALDRYAKRPLCRERFSGEIGPADCVAPSLHDRASDLLEQWSSPYLDQVFPPPPSKTVPPTPRLGGPYRLG